MGSIYANITLTNPYMKKSVSVRAMVDTGATHMIVTADTARELGFDLEEMSTYSLTVADARRVRVPRVQPVEIRFHDRTFMTEAAVLGDECLMGVLALEAMDLVVDPKQQRVRRSARATEGQPEYEMIQGSCHCGAVQWRFEGIPEGATACNCTVCRRYGVLWAYDYEGEGIAVSGPTQAYVRGKTLGFHFCPTCGCVAFWRATHMDENGRRRIAVNLRLAEPEAVARVPIDHFDGLGKFEDLPRDGRCVADYWF